MLRFGAFCVVPPYYLYEYCWGVRIDVPVVLVRRLLLLNTQQGFVSRFYGSIHVLRRGIPWSEMEIIGYLGKRVGDQSCGGVTMCFFYFDVFVSESGRYCSRLVP